MDKKDILFGLIIAVCLVFLFSPFASPWPDGLERVAQDKGFLTKVSPIPFFKSPIPDYACPGLENKKIATAVAGVIGTLLIFGLGYGIALLLKRQQDK